MSMVLMKLIILFGIFIDGVTRLIFVMKWLAFLYGGALVWLPNSFLTLFCFIFSWQYSFNMVIEIIRSYLKIIRLDYGKYSSYWAMQILFYAERSCIK